MLTSLLSRKFLVYSVLANRPLALLLLLLFGALGRAEAGISLVQHTSRDAGTTTSAALAFASPNTAGNWIAVCVRAGSSSSQAFTIADSNGNAYHSALQLGIAANPITFAIFYAENIKGGTNTVTVSDTVSGPFRFAILEYSGVATSNSLDATAMLQGSSTSPNSGNLTTSASGELLLGTIVTNSTAVFTAGSGYTVREFVPAEPNTKVIAEDQIQATAGVASVGASLAASDNWGAGLAAFKAAGGTAGTPWSITATGGTNQSSTINTSFVTQLQATVKDFFNSPVSGVTVTFADPASGASGTFAGGVNTATTNAQGVATAAVFTANSIAGGPYNVTASVAGVSTPANFSLTNLPGAPASISATAGTPQSATINTQFATQLQATVRDASNNLVNGVTVTFTAPTSGASGTFAGGANTATTNAQGVAIAAIFTANGTAGGPYNVTASVAGVSTPANFSLTNLANAPASITASAGTPQSATINTQFATQLQATVRDASNNPVNGVTVTFTAPTSGASGTFAGGANTATTNAQGVAIAAIFTANSTAGGPYNVTASVAGVATPTNFSLSNLPPGSSIALVQHTSRDAGSATTSSLAFVNPNAAGNWIAVCVRAGNSSAQVFTVTDSNGNTYRRAFQLGLTATQITVAIFYAENIKGGANTITVSDTVSGPFRFAILEYSGVATSNSLDVTVMGQGTGTSPNSGNLTPTASGDLLLGTIVTQNPAVFTVASGYTVEEFVPAEPNTKLVAADQIQGTAGIASASATLATSDSWGAGLAAFKAAVGVAGTPSSIAASAGTPQSATINTAFATQLQATVKDPFNSPVSGVTVTFTAPSSGASGTFAGGVNTATTNASGIATANIFTANGTAGSYTVTASVPGATSATFSLTNTAGPAAKVAATSGSGQSAAINSAFGAPLVATVTDAGNNPVSGVVVTFTAPVSGASGTFAGGVNTATTNSSGVATSATFTANATVGGPYNVTASASGATSANFSLTNLAGPPPSISTLSLTQGPVGAKITISGSNFGATQGSTSTVTFNGTPSSAASSWSDSSIDVTIPNGATTGNVIVTVGSVASNGVPFKVTPPPNITSINPTSGPVGSSVTITGTNFGPTVGPISSFVTFNGTQGRSSNWSDTSITIPVPLGATSGNVIVTVGGVVSNGVPFTVTPPPSITSLNPTTGPVGTPVTIAGANFGMSQGASTVTFNGTLATTFSTWTDTSIGVTVPTGATPGNVVVNIGGVASNGVTFTVTASTENIALVQHTSRDAGSTTSSSLAFVNPNTSGNWIAVCVRAGNSNAQVFTVSDSNGNTYKSALQLGMGVTNITFAIFYAENIKGGANTVTVSDTVSGLFRFAILEYSGVATTNSLEVATTAQGNSAAPSASATTTSSGDLLLGAIVTQNPAVFTAGSGYTIEEFVPAEPNTKLIVEDQLQRAAGSATVSASLAASNAWGAGLAAIRSASGAGLPLSVSVSPSTASVPTGYGTQAFTASLVNDFQHQGVTWSLSGAGCNGNTCGTLSNITNTSVTYNAPATVPTPAGVTLTGTSIADTTKTGTAAITVIQGVIHVAVSPKSAAVTTSQPAQFTATVTNDPSNSGVTWMVDGNNGGDATTGTVSTTGLYTPGTQPGQHTVTAVSVANASVTASATAAVTDLAGVFTYHNDNARTGQNLQEYALTTANVNSSTFGALFSCPVDGYLWAAPLYVANLTIGGQVRNVVFVATSHDSVYAFDADSPACVHLWNMPGSGMVSFLSPGVTPPSTADVGDAANDMFPEIGITSTPVIDPATNTIYVEAKTKDTVSSGCSTSSPCFFHHLHALDLLTGAEKFNGPVLISTSGFNAQIHHQRPALLLNNGTVYIGFGSHGDRNSYQGWLMGYDAATLAQKFVTRLTNSVGNRGAVWQGGAGPAADASGNIYFSTGNGIYDGTGNFGDSTLKLSPTGSILDWFTPFNQSVFAANDIDLGSAGVIILPNSVASTAHPHLALATGKVSILYLLDISQPNPGQTKMGKFNASTNQDVQEVIPVPPPNTTQLDGGIFGSPAYWNGNVNGTGNIYTTGVNFPLSQFQISNGTISTPQSARSNNFFPLRGATPVVSASGTTNGIVWILDLGAWPSNGAAILDAYDATNVSNLLFSSPSSGTGAAGPAVKFTVPTVANGKVYVGGQSKFTVFGLLPN